MSVKVTSLKRRRRAREAADVLERIEIVGFRGINRLSLMLDDNTLLLGENAWGKSSLLDALTLLLAPEQKLYRFEAHDFHFPGEESAKERHLQVVFTFCEKTSAMHTCRAIAT